MQLTLSRQTGKRLQYFAVVHPGPHQGHARRRVPRARSVRRVAHATASGNEDRTHIFNVSWNAFLPDGAQGPMDNTFGRGLLNGWQLSGISTFASGTPIWLGLQRASRQRRCRPRVLRHADTIILLTRTATIQSGGLRRSTPATRVSMATKVGEKMLDINCIGFPAFGKNGEVLPPDDIRTPSRQNHDLTLFKNFAIHGDQKLQMRFGFFNIFNQAFATTIIGAGGHQPRAEHGM